MGWEDVDIEENKYILQLMKVLKFWFYFFIWNINFLFLTQEEIDKIVETTESVTGNIQSLKNKIQVLTSEVEEEEERLKQVTV